MCFPCTFLAAQEIAGTCVQGVGFPERFLWDMKISRRKVTEYTVTFSACYSKKKLRYTDTQKFCSPLNFFISPTFLFSDSHCRNHTPSKFDTPFYPLKIMLSYFLPGLQTPAMDDGTILFACPYGIEVLAYHFC